MNEPLAFSIADQINRLREVIDSLNKKANLLGLFAQHVLSGQTEKDFRWQVLSNDKEWLEKKYDKNNAHDISKLGYSIHLAQRGYGDANTQFIKSIENLKKRKIFDGTHVSFPFQPVTLLGIVLGVKKLSSSKNQESNSEWLSSILKERKKRKISLSFHRLLYQYIEAELKDITVEISVSNNELELADLSLIVWGLRKKKFKLSNSKSDLCSIEIKLLDNFIRVDISKIDSDKIPFIWSSINYSIFQGISKLTKSTNVVVDILSKFESAMKRWRYDTSNKNPVRWPVPGEIEVQDIIWLILKPTFEDIVDEENLPKLGHSSYKPDFAIPSLRLLIEIKFVRKKVDFKKIEKEIMEDSVGYLTANNNYDSIVVFIYDHSCSVQEYDITKRDLKKINGIEDVIIASRPSQLPS